MSKIKKNNISIIIPSYRSEKYIIKILNAINSQTIKPLEVLIIDYKTSNKLYEIINRLKLNLNTKLIYFPNKSKEWKMLKDPRFPKGENDKLIFPD